MTTMTMAVKNMSLQSMRKALAMALMRWPAAEDPPAPIGLKDGAGDGNRTRVSSLEG